MIGKIHRLDAVSPICHYFEHTHDCAFRLLHELLDSMHGYCELVLPRRGELHALLLSIDHHSSHIDMDGLLVPGADQSLLLEVEAPLPILGLEGQRALEM